MERDAKELKIRLAHVSIEIDEEPRARAAVPTLNRSPSVALADAASLMASCNEFENGAHEVGGELNFLQQSAFAARTEAAKNGARDLIPAILDFERELKKVRLKFD